LILAIEDIGSNLGLLFVSRDIARENELRQENGQYGISGELLLLPYPTSTRRMGTSLSGEEWEERITILVLPESYHDYHTQLPIISKASTQRKTV
jgi:hypothetical protein